MSIPRIKLFGKFVISWEGIAAPRFEGNRVQELFCYLLLHRDRHLSREVLADVIWKDCNSEKTRKYLRQALWHLQVALAANSSVTNSQILLIDHHWVKVNTSAGFWLDVAVFEQTFEELRRKSGWELDADLASRAEEAVELYSGDLLEGWYQDWCLCERERLQNSYLIILDKLMGHSAATQNYEKALEYGALILLQDRAHERTHRQMMLLHYYAGNRSAALRQYERCRAALKEELDTKPGRRTQALYEQIREDKFETFNRPPLFEMAEPKRATGSSVPEVLDQLRRLQAALFNLQEELQQKIQFVELDLDDHR